MGHRFALLPAALLVACVGLTAPAAAQDRDRDRDRRYAGDADNPAAIAFNNGYQRGLEHGQADLRSRRSADFRRDHDYRDADQGYDRRFGSREEYREQFRRGYQAGYVDGYEGRARSGYGAYGQPVPRAGDRAYGYGYPTGTAGYGRNIAEQNGYNDGYQRGVDDARHNRRYDLDRQNWFRDGDRHYDSRFGTRDHYRVEYREGFRQGYEAGYRGARNERYRR